MSELKFVVDHNVGRLAKWLRMVGFDTKFFTGENDSDMVEMALAENRIMLTRDTRIMERRVVADGRLKAILIESDRLEKQLAQVITVLGLYKSRFRPFTICLEDNEPLIERTKDEVKDRVPPYVYQTQQHFVECPKCRRIYWRGTHWQAMSRQIEQSAGQS